MFRAADLSLQKRWGDMWQKSLNTALIKTD